ncbi:hypothetical protein [Micromonospora chersina]|uniref:hypothetical protein n=1 Tax=Micromonospora chersina TaxID=47854 RepID=UPI00371F9889
MAPLIYPKDREDAKDLARQLLDAAGDERHDEVQTTTDGPLGLAFAMPDDLASTVLSTGDGRTVVDTKSTSAGAGADVSEADAKAGGGSSQPSEKASRSSRTSRSG